MYSLPIVLNDLMVHHPNVRNVMVCKNTCNVAIVQNHFGHFVKKSIVLCKEEWAIRSNYVLKWHILSLLSFLMVM